MGWRVITYQEESYATARDDELLEKHYDALAFKVPGFTLDPDWDQYDALESSGALVCFTARDEGKLVGYAVFFLTWMLKSKTLRIAANDVFFLAPGYRGRDGLRDFMRYAENELLEYGADVVSMTVKFDRDWSPVLRRLGYADEEKTVMKSLRKDHA